MEIIGNADPPKIRMACFEAKYNPTPKHKVSRIFFALLS